MKERLTIMDTVIIGLATSFAMTVFFGFVYFVIGLFTGIYGMCAIAPQWWEEIYSKLPIVIPFLGIVSGITLAIWLDKKSQKGLI